MQVISDVPECWKQKVLFRINVELSEIKGKKATQRIMV